MNKKQKLVLMLALTAFVVVGLIADMGIGGGGGGGSRSRGGSVHYSYHLPELAVWWTVIGVCTGGLLVILKTGKRPKDER